MVVSDVIERLTKLSKVGFGYDIKPEDREALQAATAALSALPAGVLEWVEGVESAPYASTVLAGFFDSEYGDWAVQLFVAERPTSPFTHWMLVLSPDEVSARILSALSPAGVETPAPSPAPSSLSVGPVDFAKLYSHPLAKQFHEAIQAADHLPCNSTDVVVKLGELKSSVEAEINRLLSNAKTDAKLLQQYHAWCVEHGCEPRTSDLYTALATTEGQEG